jgi:hypothetical protein
MTKTMLSVAVCVALAACATAPEGPQQVSVQISKVPVAEPCAANPGQQPDFPDTPAAIGAAANIFERAKLYASGRQLRLDWEARLEAANAGCRAATESKP